MKQAHSYNHLTKAVHVYWPLWEMSGHFCGLGDFRFDGEVVLFYLDLVTAAWSGVGVLWTWQENTRACPLPSSHKMVFSFSPILPLVICIFH